ncbi:unnamed protein product [Anisakis simplex]|uniref:Fibronectin type-III domain-containing protein n=1 Tax=Anisakis simplex TaxID=6269 RepID=A0A0M3K748_ANISI|nr:unnamed protein product [Anisakis simplex]
MSIKRIVLVRKKCELIEVLHASTPVTVSVQVDNASLVHISIDVSGIEDDIMGYKVYFTRDDEQSDESFVDWQQIHVQSSDRSYTLKMDEETLHLKPNIRYRLRVTTSTSNGETEPSEVVEFKTSNTVSQAPSNVNVVIAASNSFTVYFDAAIDPNSTDIQSKYVNVSAPF